MGNQQKNNGVSYTNVVAYVNLDEFYVPEKVQPDI